MISTPLATIHFHFVFDFALLVYFGPNQLTISSSQKSFPVFSMGLHLWTLWCVQSSETFVFGSVITPSFNFTPKLPHFGWIFACSSIFVAAHISLVYNIVDRMVLFKWLAFQLFSRFALRISFIMVNAFHFDLILQEISASMSWNIFPIHSKYTNSFTALISSLPTMAN